MKAKIKSVPEDFIVDEMLADGSFASECKDKDNTRVRERNVGKENKAFLWVAVKKVNWNTIDLAKEIARAAEVSENRVNYGGIKDRAAVAYQVFSVNTKEECWKVREKIARIRDVEVISAWRNNKWIKNEDFVGNRFVIILRECDFKAKDLKKLEKFPNYFGEQRFGSMRGNSHLVGFYLLRGDYDSAIKEYFAGIESEENVIGKREREMYERSRKYGAENFVKNNWRVFKLCVNAAQSHLFNEELRMRLAEKETEVLEGEYTCGRNKFGFADVNSEGGEFTVIPLAGSECKLLNKYKRMLLKKYGLEREDFERIGMKGGWRTLYAPVLDLEVKDVMVSSVQISFRLQKGSYATEMIKSLLGEAISI